MNDNTSLSESQRNDIIKAWNSDPSHPPSLLKLIKIAFPDKNIDGRSKEGRLVKAFLATREIKARAAHEYKAVNSIELSDENKEFIENNYKMMTFVEVARVLFTNEKISNLNKEATVVQDYIKNIDPSHRTEDEINITHEEYKSPKTFDKTIVKINQHIAIPIDKNKTSPIQKKGITSFLGYINTYRFLHQINTYESPTDRALFESSFVRYTYDKPDLTQEEVDQYIVLAIEVVIASNIQRRVEHLQRLLDESAMEAGAGGQRIAMSLVEAISTSHNEYNQSVNRQQKLLNDLKEKRSDRLKSQLSDNASILNLVEMWKNEETRKKMIHLAELRKESLKEEVDNLSSMEEVKARILGISEGEILN